MNKLFESSNIVPTRVTPRFVGLVLFFCLCLYPIMIDRFSWNYSFVLFPLAVATCTGRLRRPSDALLFAMSAYSLIYLIATLYQYELFGYFDRRTSSFLLFMSMFAFVFVDLDDEMVSAFKFAIIVAAVYFSLLSIYLFRAAGGASLGYEAKDLVGGDNYGFIYVLAFWLLFFSVPKKIATVGIKAALIFVVLIGLVLTFSRASIVALMISFATYCICSIPEISVGRLVRSIVFTAAGAAIVVYALVNFFPVALDFFDTRLFQFALSQEAVQNHLATADSSEGARIVVWAGILDSVLKNPLTGAGFLGVWTIQATVVLGSAHNQYFDVLFRTGPIGFAIYAALLVQATAFFWRRDRELFWGLVGIFAYGLFHETFKESQGGFVLAFLLGMVSQTRTSSRNSLVFYTFRPTLATSPS